MIPIKVDKHRNLYEDPLSVLFQWYDFVIFLMMFPSNSVLVFLRKNLGYRLMRPWVFGAVFLILWAMGSTGALFASYAGSEGSAVASNVATCAFAIAMAVFAFFQRRNAWKLVFRDKDPIHTMSRGDSRLCAILPLPEWFIQRYVEPILIFMIGLLMSFVFHWVTLGMWFFISSVCLATIEAMILDKTLSAFLDIRDGRVEAAFMREMDQIGDGKTQPKAKVGGLAIASPELMRIRESRLKEIPPKPPESLPGT